MAGKYETPGKKRTKWYRIPVILLVLLLTALSVRSCFYEEEPEVPGLPTLTVQTPPKLSASQTGEIVLDVLISDLGEARYPAMSVSISFDPSRLEFLGIEEGNVFIHNTENGVGRQLPDWSCNVQNSNDTGLINIMYLDMTGGKNAFTKELLAEDYNVVLRLKFRLRGSVRPGDVLDLIVEDAVFAASDETQSLAMTTDTLKTKNGRLVIGE